MENLAEKLAELSPAKRELLLQKLRQTKMTRISGENAAEDLSEKSERGEHLPLSFAQQRLWFLQQLNSRNTAYNMPFGIRLNGNLSVATLEKTLSEIIARHEILRTNFRVCLGEPEQIIFPPFDVNLAIEDFSNLPTSEKQQIENQVAVEESRIIFNLEDDRLLRFRLIKFSPGEHILFLTLHHIVADGWSVGILAREFAALYQTFSSGEISKLPPLSLQYADFAIRQKGRLKGDYLEKQLGYWRGKLHQFSAPLNLPFNPVKTAKGKNRADYVSFSVPPDLSSELNETSKSSGATLFMTLLAAFKILLCRYANETDVTVGTPTAGRTQTELEKIVGFFVNTLVLRTDLVGNPTFTQALGRVKETVLSAFDNQEIPFEMLVKEFKIGGDEKQKLVQTMFVWQNAESDLKVSLPDLSIEFFDIPLAAAKFDLTLAMSERRGAIYGTFEFDTSVFSRETIERFTENLLIILERIGENSDFKISSENLLTAKDEAVLRKLNANRNDFDARPVHEIIAEKAVGLGDKLAVADGKRNLTFKELNTEAEKIARIFQKKGIAPELIVGVLLEPSAKMIVCQLAVLKTGAAYLPLDANLPAERLRFMLEDAKAEIVITDKKSALKITDKNLSVLYVEDFKNEENLLDESLTKIVNPRNLAYIIYTSGSTGNPKGAAIEHASLSNLAAWHRRYFGVSPNDRASRVAGTGFDPSVWETWANLAAGASIHLPPEDVRANPSNLKNWLVSEQISIAYLPTPLAEFLLQEKDLDLPPLKILSTGGDALRIRPENDKFALINLYGPTECTVNATAGTVEPKISADGKNPSIGFPVTNTEIYILNRFLQPVPFGGIGEICIGGIGLARGYSNQTALTAEKFVPHPFSGKGERLYQTGDLGQFLPSGEIEFLGRFDNQVKLRGYRIELGEIERALSEVDAIHSCAVVINETIKEKILTAFITVKSEKTLTADEIKESLKRRLPVYMIPQTFTFLNAMPLSPNGKIDRKNLAQREITLDSAENFAEPENEIEKRLANVWSKMLGIEKVSVKANFFEIGGHSLLAAHLLERLKSNFGANISLSEFFRNPTIKNLAKHLERAATEKHDSCLVLLEKNTDVKNFFCVHPVLGEVSGYLNLAQSLSANVSFYALQSPGLFDDEPALPSVEEMAERYVKAVRTIQPRGKYVLGGWSAGGAIAFEMARQLSAAGETVELLALFDSVFADAASKINSQHRNIWGLFARHLGFSDSDLEQFQNSFTAVSADEILKFMKRNLKVKSSVGNLKDEQFFRLFKIFKNNLTAWQNYRPGLFDGHTVLFQASEKSDESKIKQVNSWRNLIKNDLSVMEVEGNHFSMMFLPKVLRVADELAKRLEENRQFKH